MKSFRPFPAFGPLLLLLVPLIAMQFTSEVNWSVSDFIVAGVLLLGCGLLLERAWSRTGNFAHRLAYGLAIFTGLLLIWVNLAVGLIGSEDNSVNLLYGLVLLTEVFGSLVVRFRPQGMFRVLLLTAAVQTSIPVIALLAGWMRHAYLPFELGANALFVLLFVVSAQLFNRSRLAV